MSVEVSESLFRVYDHLVKNPGSWLSNLDLAKRIKMPELVVQAHTLQLARGGVVEGREITVDGVRYQIIEEPTRHKKGDLELQRALEQARTVFVSP